MTATATPTAEAAGRAPRGRLREVALMMVPSGLEEPRGRGRIGYAAIDCAVWDRAVPAYPRAALTPRAPPDGLDARREPNVLAQHLSQGGHELALQHVEEDA
jgi:hypothetical protein